MNSYNAKRYISMRMNSILMSRVFWLTKIWVLTATYLHSQLVASMTPTVDDIKRRYWQYQLWIPSEICNVLIQGNLAGIHHTVRLHQKYQIKFQLYIHVRCTENQIQNFLATTFLMPPSRNNKGQGKWQLVPLSHKLRLCIQPLTQPK